jgi:phage-related protein
MVGFFTTFANSVQSFFTQDIPDAFHSATSYVNENLVQPVYNGVSRVGTGISGSISSIVGTVRGDIGNLLGGARDVIYRTEDTLASTIKGVTGDVSNTIIEAGDNFEGVTNNLQLPLIAGALLLGIILLKD